MGRRKGVVKNRLVIHIPEDLDERLRKRLEDPLRNKVRHGSLSELVTAMLYDYLRGEDKSVGDL